MPKKPYTPYIPLDSAPIIEDEHDSQGLIDAVKAEFFPHEAGPWYTIQPCGAFDSVKRGPSRMETDSYTAFASLAGIYARTR